MSLQSYQKTQNATEHPRNVEYRLFADVTRGLLKAREEKRGPAREPGHEPGRGGTIAEAVYRNRALWITLEADCIQSRNALPAGLRAAIISLALWVNRYSSSVLKGDGSLDALIDVNRSVMEGLSEAA